MTDVGDAIEVTFNAPTGATVTLDWLNPAGVATLSAIGVPENPPASGLYPVTVTGNSTGIWTARFTATGTVNAVETFNQAFDDPRGPAPLASVGEYTDMFGALSAARQTVAKVLLRRASQLVRDRHPGIDAKIAAGTISANSAALAVLNMVARVMRNPAGLRSETIGPISKSFDPDASSGWLTYSDADAALIDPDSTAATGSSKTRAGTIRLGAGLAPHRYGGWRG